jgi:hypothetical protein
MVLVEADRGELLLRLDSRGRGGEAVMGGRLRWRQWAEGCGDGGGGGRQQGVGSYAVSRILLQPSWT